MTIGRDERVEVMPQPPVETLRQDSESAQLRCSIETATTRVVENRRASCSAQALWDVMSNVDVPELWNPFLDSRQVEARPRPPRVYYPSAIAALCPRMIEFKPTRVDSDKKTLMFEMHTGPLVLFCECQARDAEGSGFLDVTVRSNLNQQQLPGIEQVLAQVVKDLAGNITILAEIKAPTTDREFKRTVSGSLSERHPELAVSKMERIDLRSVDMTEIFKHRKPVVVTGYGQSLENFAKLGDLSWWRRTFGSQTLQALTFRGAAHAQETRKFGTTVANLIDLIESNPNSVPFAVYEYRAYLLLGLFEHLRYPALLPQDCEVVTNNVWIGAKGVRSTLHQDGRWIDYTGGHASKTHNFNFQIIGRKHCVIVNPEMTPRLYVKPASILGEVLFPESRIDFFAPLDFGAYPALQGLPVYESMLEPGDMVYVPRGWWHSFHALENSINANFLFTNAKY